MRKAAPMTSHPADDIHHRRACLTCAGSFVGRSPVFNLCFPTPPFFTKLRKLGCVVPRFRIASDSRVAGHATLVGLAANEVQAHLRGKRSSSWQEPQSSAMLAVP